ncbi:CBL-interacting serine/threonine-protein kinase 17 isoform X1 [Brassica napus]|uniref:CBL-interacting serine/threonine-protein kinase 17 isoform X1 n=1 Tax=Brassica napus TaxID=3708 RepID=UPI0020787927|nr:CBL-interacting serine/threonine-protein kinase 17 isoform X1 [Brassica napus]XP_048626542.1 CBL-interacting serine/threonine-protein kinase 17 isoform X1 [Brassica napus]
MVTKEMRVGKYELGKTLGEGNSANVKLARDTVSGQSFAVKIIDKSRISRLNVSLQIKREIRTLKVLKHPNVVRLHEVLASKTNIYMVLEYVTGGDLFDRIVCEGKISEREGRKMFQQLIDGLNYCHYKGVFHRDLKLENVLLDAKGHIKITDFGLSALPQHFREDGLLHTACGSPNYVAPEVLVNKGYDGAASDIWSCGVILYAILTGCLPFDDTNLAAICRKIVKGDPPIPRWISPGAKTMIKRMLDPNPMTRITIAGIKANDWFKHDYSTPSNCHDEDDAISIQDVYEEEKTSDSPTVINAFQLIGMSLFLDLSGLFETENVSERQIRFTTNKPVVDVLYKIKTVLMEMGFCVQKKHTMLKAIQEESTRKGQGGLSVTAEVFEIIPLLNVVELRKSHGDSSLYNQLCERLSNELDT